MLLGFFYPKHLLGQSKATQKAALRYEIEAKRMGVDAGSNDALPRSREFLRIDSSYYVGWFFEGFYKYLHAADYLGFKNAIAPLEKALYLLERDYAKELQTRSNDIQVYYPVYQYQVDYGRIAAALRECFANTDQPEKVVTLMRRALAWKFQKEYFLDPYNYLAWICHRYRFNTQKQYSFLGNSIQENEQLAMRYLDSSLRNIEKNKKFNNGLFRPGYALSDQLGVYHYKCILYSYALNIDSAVKYYEIMRRNGQLPHNNFANFENVCGHFENADKEYQIAATVDNTDKRLQEWAYYTSILQIAKAEPQEATLLAESMIKAYGSSPGFGWYNIALARSLSYAGQIEAAKKALEKAKHFKELHIGTTLGQNHYDFSIQLQELIQQEQAIAFLKFEHQDWWRKPSILSTVTQLSAEKLMLQYLIVNQLAQNPERDRVIYKLFSTESTVCWDEVWFLIKDFSTAYFVKKFEQELKENKRKPIDKYFKLFLARLYLKQSNPEKAKILLQSILKDKNIEPKYEQLFLARCYQALANCASIQKNIKEKDAWNYLSFKTFPQLAPFSGMKIPVQFSFNGSENSIIKILKQFNFDWRNETSQHCTANIRFYLKGGKKALEYQLLDATKKQIITGNFSYQNPEIAAKKLALLICKIGTNVPIVTT